MDASQKTVLLVDDDAQFLSSAAEVLSGLAAGTWSIATVSSGGEALGWLQNQPADMVVIDVNMPVLDGVQLLELLQRRFPAVTKIVLTGEASPEQRAACLTAGAELVLDKPTDANAWKGLHATLDSLLHAPREEGFRGVLRKVGLSDVIQMECLAANSSVLEITGAGLKGRLYIRQGQIVHARLGDLEGTDALNSLMSLPGGSFHLLPFSEPDRETISGQWEFLLMEAARVRDELLNSSAGEPPPPDTLPDPADLDTFIVQPAAPATAMEPVAQEPAPQVKPDPAQKPEPSQPDTTTGMQPVVKETLICSLQGETLYEWHCQNPQERISLLEFITRRAAGMGAGLPLGQFERFEAVENGARCVAKLEGEQALFVRIQSVLAGGPGASGTP